MDQVKRPPGVRQYVVREGAEFVDQVDGKSVRISGGGVLELADDVARMHADKLEPVQPVEVLGAQAPESEA